MKTDDNPQQPRVKNPRRGSDKRQRTKLTAHRWLKEEFRLVADRADKAGLSFGAFVRAAAIGDPGPRARRRPTIDQEQLIRALALHGRYGNNMNQIAHNGNAGNPVNLPELRSALKEWAEIRDAMYKALGKDQGPEP